MVETYYHLGEDVIKFKGISVPECYMRAMGREDWSLSHVAVDDPADFILEGSKSPIKSEDYNDEGEAETDCAYVGWSVAPDIFGYAAIKFVRKSSQQTIPAPMGYCIAPPDPSVLPEEWCYCNVITPLRLRNGETKARDAYVSPVYGGQIFPDLQSAQAEFERRLDKYACPLAIRVVTEQQKGIFHPGAIVSYAYPTLAGFSKEPIPAEHLYPVYEISYYFRYIEHDYEYDAQEAAYEEYCERLADEERERQAGLW